MSTAFNDGKTSTLMLFSRTFIFNLLGIFILYTLLGYQGLFLAIEFIEGVTIFFAIILLQKLKNLISWKYKLETGNIIRINR